VIAFACTIRVRYADTDQMAVVNNGKYLEYFEVGRTELLRSLGLSYAEFERMGFFFPLIEAHCEYLRPALYDDLLRITAGVASYGGPRLRIDYQVERDGAGTLLARGYTVHAFTDRKSGRPLRPPAVFIETLARGETR
jgi:acyl-CoA thioester hydrolase